MMPLTPSNISPLANELLKHFAQTPPAAPGAAPSAAPGAGAGEEGPVPAAVPAAVDIIQTEELLPRLLRLEKYKRIVSKLQAAATHPSSGILNFITGEDAAQPVLITSLLKAAFEGRAFRGDFECNATSWGDPSNHFEELAEGRIAHMNEEEIQATIRNARKWEKDAVAQNAWVARKLRFLGPRGIQATNPDEVNIAQAEAQRNQPPAPARPAAGPAIPGVMNAPAGGAAPVVNILLNVLRTFNQIRTIQSQRDNYLRALSNAPEHSEDRRELQFQVDQLNGALQALEGTLPVRPNPADPNALMVDRSGFLHSRSYDFSDMLGSDDVVDNKLVHFNGRLDRVLNGDQVFTEYIRESLEGTHESLRRNVPITTISLRSMRVRDIQETVEELQRVSQKYAASAVGRTSIELIKFFTDLGLEDVSRVNRTWLTDRARAALVNETRNSFTCVGDTLRWREGTRGAPVDEDAWNAQEVDTRTQALQQVLSRNFCRALDEHASQGRQLRDQLEAAANDFGEQQNVMIVHDAHLCVGAPGMPGLVRQPQSAQPGHATSPIFTMRPSLRRLLARDLYSCELHPDQQSYGPKLCPVCASSGKQRPLNKPERKCLLFVTPMPLQFEDIAAGVDMVSLADEPVDDAEARVLIVEYLDRVNRFMTDIHLASHMRLLGTEERMLSNLLVGKSHTRARQLMMSALATSVESIRKAHDRRMVRQQTEGREFPVGEDEVFDGENLVRTVRMICNEEAINTTMQGLQRAKQAWVTREPEITGEEYKYVRECRYGEDVEYWFRCIDEAKGAARAVVTYKSQLRQMEMALRAAKTEKEREDLSARSKVLIRKLRKQERLSHNKLLSIPHFIILWGDPGVGKCLGRGTPVMMHDGHAKPVEEVRCGDWLMGPDSKPRQILSTTSGIGPLYRVDQKIGDSFVCNDAHLLSLQTTNRPANGIIGGQTVFVTAKDYCQKSKAWKHAHKGWKAAVEFPSASLPIDPYWLGLWLGDGSERGVAITVAHQDKEIVEWLPVWAEANSMRIRQEAGAGCATWHFAQEPEIRADNGSKVNPVKDKMRSLDLIENKHIPDQFKFNDSQSRLKLLAGLLDSDGYHTKSGSLQFSSVSRRLADDVLWLGRSLGFRTTFASGLKRIKSIGYEVMAYTVTLGGSLGRIPTKLARKQAHDNPQKRSTRYGIDVTPIGIGEYFGFTIDGDRQFLLGDFTVTHNTVFAHALSELARLDLKELQMDQATGSYAGEPAQMLSAALKGLLNMNGTVILLDEIDGQVVPDSSGPNQFEKERASILLRFFGDKDTKKRFEERDIFLVATTNFPDNIRGALLDRGELYEVPNPNTVEAYEKFLREIPHKLQRENKDRLPPIADETTPDETWALIHREWAKLDLHAIAEALFKININPRRLQQWVMNAMLYTSDYLRSQHKLQLYQKAQTSREAAEEYAITFSLECNLDRTSGKVNLLKPEYDPAKSGSGFMLTTEALVYAAANTEYVMGRQGTFIPGKKNGLSKLRANYWKNPQILAQPNPERQLTFEEEDQKVQKEWEGKPLLDPAPGNATVEPASPTAPTPGQQPPPEAGGAGVTTPTAPTAPEAPGSGKKRNPRSSGSDYYYRIIQESAKKVALQKTAQQVQPAVQPFNPSFNPAVQQSATPANLAPKPAPMKDVNDVCDFGNAVLAPVYRR